MAGNSRVSTERQVVVLLGPTAVGKTAVACALQTQLAKPSRLISVDSTLVYRGMDIGSAKPTAAELKAHPHELIDIRDPEETYTAADFVRDADKCVESAFASGELPVLVGGTMLYAKRFLEGIAQLPEANPALRAELEEEFARHGGAQLHAELCAADPQAAENIHPNNPQRLIRALEVVRLTQRPLSELWREQNTPSAVERLSAKIIVFALLPDNRQALHSLIEQRFAAMLDAGFEAELKKLAARPGVHADLPAMRAVGYRQGMQYLRGELDAEGFRQQALTATRRLAKRQLTWLRQWQDIHRLTWGQADRIAEQMACQISV